MSDIQAPKRLAKVATELNQSKATIIEFLKAKGLSIENNPNARLDNEQYNILVKEFQTDRILKERAEKELNRLKDEVNENSENVTNEQDSLEIQNLSESDSLKIDDETESQKDESQYNIIKKRKRPRIERGMQKLEKKAIVIGSELELEVSIKVPPGFLFFNLDNGMQGSLHVSELNWNFGLSQSDFRSIQVGSKLRVYVIGFDDKYKKVHLSRKNLKTIERPSRSLAWSNLILHKEISATVFEEFRNKVIVELDLGLFATIPLLEGKFYQVGTKVQVIPIRKRVDQNIIECTLRELVTSSEEQSSEVIESFKEQKPENNFSTSEFCLNSYQQLSESLYWNYFSKEEQELLKLLFEETESLFSKVEKGSKAIYIEFDFDFNAYNDFTRNIAPSIFDFEKLPTNFTDKDLLLELSKFNFWYTQFEQQRRTDGAEQNSIEKTFTLFNEMVSIRGIVSEEGALKIRFVKAKIKTESLKEKQTSLRLNDVFYINRPIVFSQFGPINTFNKKFIKAIDNKLTAFKIFEVAKTKSLDILQKQGKEFKIFSNFLESQIDYEIKGNDETECTLSDCKLESDIQTDGITFKGRSVGQHSLILEDRVSISIELKKDILQSIGIGSISAIDNNELKIKSNIENFDLIKGGVIIKKNFSTKQYTIQLSVLNKFFANKLPLDTFYKIFHDKEGIDPPEIVKLKFDNPIFEKRDNPQTQAVMKAVGNKNILLIQGPPGTGKTTVITEIVKQLIKRGEKILVTSQTHIAVDNVLERIKDDPRLNIARVGHQDAISEFAVEYLIEEARKRFAIKIQKIVEIKIELINYHVQGRDISEFSRQSFDLPLTFDWENIEEFISLVQNSDLKQSQLLIESLEQWKEVIVKTPILLTDIFLKNLNVVFGTCIGIATNKIFTESETYFDTVILDEAGKANISETLTAISRARKIILVGDHKQLPPYLDRERVEYFKRFSKEVVEQKTNDNEIKQALGASFFEYLQRDGVLSSENKILLAEQHRMHPDIGNFISQSFYDSELLNGEHTKENVIPLPEPFDKQIVFIDTSSDSSSAESLKNGSYYNQLEAEFIINKIVPELERNNIDSKSYAIVSPYSKQCEKIRELLSERDSQAYNSVEVATLDSFQGREYDIIIFSFTRSAIKSKVGFLDDARRLNVAFSRARKKLILIGNAETLISKYSHYDPYYTTLFTNLWRYASRYGKTYRINELDYRRLQSSFKIGDVLKGKVKKIQDRVGVFVDLGIKDGLIPISFFSKHPSEYLEQNQEIEIEIKKIDEGGRITLLLHDESLRNILKPIPQAFKRKERKIDLFKNDFKISDVVEGIVVKIIEIDSSTLKIFVELKHGVQGTFFTSSRNYKVKTGNMVKVTINKIDIDRQIVKCKLKL